MPKTTYRNGKNALADVLPPQDKKAERALLGALVVDQDAIHSVAPTVKPADFYLESNGVIYQAMLDLSARSEPADIVTIMAELRRQGRADVGDGQDKAEVYLLGLVEGVPTSVNALTYARTVAEMAQRRRLIQATGKIATAAFDETEDMHTVIEEAQALVFEVSHDARGQRQLAHVSAGMGEYLDEMARRFDDPSDVSGMSTGFLDLDKLLNGLKPQELVIVAGRPGMGKTGLLMGMAVNMTVKAGKRGAIFSLEMGKGELRNRLIANMINADLQDLDRGDLTQTEQEAFYKATGKLSQAPLYVNDLPGLSPEEILADARRVASEVGLDYVMVDYLGLIDAPGTRSRYEAVSAAARSLKNLAKDLDCPVIAAAQLSRAVEQRGEKRPLLSDLRDSGEIEEAADVVVMLYRDEYYNGATDQTNRGEAGIVKQRNGPTGQVNLFWRDYSASYHNLEVRELTL
jgi:replicative DNA helicase